MKTLLTSNIKEYKLQPQRVRPGFIAHYNDVQPLIAFIKDKVLSQEYLDTHFPYMTSYERAILVFRLKNGLEVSSIPQVGPTAFRERVPMLQEEIDEMASSVDSGDFFGTLDAAGDLLYILLDLFVQVGIPSSIIFHPIQISNLTKEGGTIEKGKLVNAKNAAYKEPDIQQFFIEYLRILDKY